jgi:isoleucyl-tRNA synthetase
MASPILRGGDLRISNDASDFSEVIRQVLNPIWNAYSFFTLYANADGYRASFRTDASGLLDRYILAKTADLVEKVTASMDAFEIAPACAEVQGFLDALNNWYIRRSRERFWAPGGGNDSVSIADKADAYDTLYTVLVTLMKTCAPLLPLVAEEIWLGLTGDPSGDSSVHLEEWPDAADLPADPALVAGMDRIREVCSAGLHLREEHRLRARLPLNSLTIAGEGTDALGAYLDLVRDELNVKSVDVTDNIEAVGSFSLLPNAKVLGPRLGKAVQQVIAESKAGNWSAGEDGSVTVAGQRLESGEYELRLLPKEGSAAAALSDNRVVVVLDTDVSPELHAEGIARDVIRLIQAERRNRDLQVTDRIRCHLDTTVEVIDALERHRDQVGAAVLAEELTLAEGVDDSAEAKVEGHPVSVQVSVI